MVKYKKIIETIRIYDNGEIEKETKTTLHTIKSWEELTREEKEKEIENNQELIYRDYQDYLYENFKDELEYLREEFKNIEFGNIYLDSNSQGWWIDNVVGLKYNDNGIEVYGNYIEVSDIDLYYRQTIRDFDINIYDYYVSDSDMEKIKKTKKYQYWYNKIKEDIQNWINRVNEICSYIGDREYVYPYNLSDEEDRDYLDNYFSDEEFEFIKESEENDN